MFTWLQLCIFEACLCCSFLKQQSELVVCSLADGGLVHQVSSSSDGGPCLWDLCRWAAVYTTGWLHLNMSLCWLGKTRTSPNVGKHTSTNWWIWSARIYDNSRSPWCHSTTWNTDVNLPWFMTTQNLCDKPTIYKPSDYTHSAPPALTGFPTRRCNVLTSLETSSEKIFQSFSLFLDGI